LAEPPLQGTIIEYPYLWLEQAERGETEGRKDRPVCLALSVRKQDTQEHHLLLLAITSKPPRDDQTAILIPDIERRRAGLARYPVGWVVTSEYNYDIAERSFYYDPRGVVVGAFSQTFMRQIAAALRDNLLKGRGRVTRSD
jgi:hypothetical protein